MNHSQKNISRLLRELNEIGIALSAEKDHARLLELILIKAMEITNADGDTLYTYTDDQRLKFEILYNRSLNVHKGGTSGEEIQNLQIGRRTLSIREREIINNHVSVTIKML